MTAPSQVSDLQAVGHSIFGPMMLAYVRWMSDSVEDSGVTHLYFVARDGYFLHKLWQDAIDLGLLSSGKDLPRAYLHCSRRSLYAALPKSDRAYLSMLGSGTFEGDLFAALDARLGLPAELLKSLGLRNRKISMPRDLASVIDDLAPAEKQINEESARNADLLRRYLAQIGFSNPERAGLIDVGFAGSIQRSLHELTGAPMTGFYFATSQAVEPNESAESAYRGCFAERFDPANSPPIHRFSRCLEAWLTSPEGQVDGYVAEVDDVSPAFGPLGPVQENFTVAEAIYHGVREFLREAAGKNLPDIRKPAELLFAAGVLGGRFQRIAPLLSFEDRFTGLGDLSLVDVLAELRDAR